MSLETTDLTVFDQENDKVAEFSPLKATANMVATYSKRLVGSERAQQFVATLLLMAKQQPKIGLSTPESLGSAMMACVHLNLMPNTPAQHAFIIPYMNSRLGKYEAQFQIGYKGMLELAYRTGQVKTVSAELVFAEDKFSVDLGSKRRLVHKPSFDIDRTDYKKVTHVYATATLLTGEVVFNVLSRKELDKVARVSRAAASDAPWKQWPEEMAKKTVLKRLIKLLPSTSDDQRIAMASAIDSWAQVGKLGLTEEGELLESEPEAPAKEIAQPTEEITHESLEEKM